MCSIGWIKLKDKWILFKNRDRLKEETPENTFIKDDQVIAFGAKDFPGFWVGINKFGIGIALAYGPVVGDDEKGAAENFDIIEKILRTCKTIEEAKPHYLEFIKKLDFNTTFNVIIADSEKAFSLEITPEEQSIKEFNDSVAKSNHFTELIKYNKKEERIETSKIRLENLKNLIANIKQGKDLIPILKFHDKENECKNICRHADIKTVSSAMYEITGGKIKLYYVLNGPPCKNEYKEEDIIF